MKLQRMCAVCRESKNKSELLRIVRKDGIISIDLEGKSDGRGAYVCKASGCILKARKVRAFERSFSGRVDAEIYDTLEAMDFGE
ncbi:MAG: YlxR family protein [Ruminococcaceae bacterium]|nr:YlxR family protein [Oscillospiraceae bacterium]